MNRFAQRAAWNSVVFQFLVLCLAPCACRKQGLLPNEQRGKTDLSAFIADQLVKCGGSNIAPARPAASGITNYVYSEDKDGVQVVCVGNKVAALRNLFQPQFGDPAMTATNLSGLSAFVYAVRQTGVAINCGLDRGSVNGTTQDVTQLVIVRSSALK